MPVRDRACLAARGLLYTAHELSLKEVDFVSYSESDVLQSTIRQLFNLNNTNVNHLTHRDELRSWGDFEISVVCHAGS